MYVESDFLKKDSLGGEVEPALLKRYVLNDSVEFQSTNII